MSAPSQKFYFVYIDESYDETHYAYSAIFINAFEWNRYFQEIVDWRKEWAEKYDIQLEYELHATKFVGGQGQPHNNRNKQYRADLFYEAIGYIEKIENLKIINAITPHKNRHLELFEWMLNRIFKTLENENAYGVLICDEGNENKLTSILRRMKKANPIPSSIQAQQAWGASATRNIPLDRIVEDPLFKSSKSSYFIQLADFVAFSLLRNEKPLLSKLTPVKTAFDQLDTVLVRQAFARDPRNKGIIRI